MTATPSNVKAAAAWLIAAVTTAVAPVGGHDLYIDYGEPTGDDPDDQIYLIDVESEATQIGMRGPTGIAAMQEVLVLLLKISVYRAGDNGKIPFERCVDIVNAVVNAVRTDPTLGGTVLNSEPGKAIYPSPAASENGLGRVCETELTIEALATN